MSLSDDDIQKIAVAISLFDWAVWAKNEMEKQQAKGSDTPVGGSPEDSASVVAGERVATSTVQPYAKASFVTPNAVAQRAERYQKAGKYRRFDELQAEIVNEAAGRVKYSSPAEKAAAVQAAAERYAKAGVWKPYAAIELELGL